MILVGRLYKGKDSLSKNFYWTLRVTACKGSIVYYETLSEVNTETGDIRKINVGIQCSNIRTFKKWSQLIIEEPKPLEDWL